MAPTHIQYRHTYIEPYITIYIDPHLSQEIMPNTRNNKENHQRDIDT